MLNVTSNIARIIDELAIFPASESIVFLPVIPQVNYKQADFAKQSIESLPIVKMKYLLNFITFPLLLSHSE
jgi:hypothetical protein